MAISTVAMAVKLSLFLVEAVTALEQLPLRSCEAKTYGGHLPITPLPHCQKRWRPCPLVTLSWLRFDGTLNGCSS